MPAVAEPVSGRSGGEPEGQQADDEAGEVHQQVSGVCHHREAAGKIPTCRETMVY